MSSPSRPITQPPSTPREDRDTWCVWFLNRSVAGTLKLEPDIERLLPELADAGIVSADRFTPQVLEVLARDADFAGAWRAGRARDAGTLEAMASSGRLTRVFSSNLFQFIAANALIFDAGLEFALTAARRALLFALTQSDESGADAAQLECLCAIAQQCFLNEYAYWEEPDETVWVELLAESLAAVAASGEPLRPELVALYASYRGLPTLDLPPAAEAYLKKTPAMAALLVSAVDEPRIERRIAENLPTVTPIRDATSLKVRAQYEESPYPRWRIVERAMPKPWAERIGHYPGIDLAALGAVDSPRILVAGCGTGANAITFASMLANADVTAVDLSRASLAYAKRQSDRLGLAITHLHGDILEVPGLGRQFDFIECSGVLHHMKDPEAGARALWQCLRPGGLLRLALYTRAGRDAFAPARDFIARGGYVATAESIRRFRHDVQAAAAGANPGLHGVTVPMDFYSLSMCRDLVFHVQEAGYSVAEIEALAKHLGGKIVTLFLDRPFAVPVATDAGPNLARLAAMERTGEMVGPLYTFVLQKPAN